MLLREALIEQREESVKTSEFNSCWQARSSVGAAVSPRPGAFTSLHLAVELARRSRSLTHLSSKRGSAFRLIGVPLMNVGVGMLVNVGAATVVQRVVRHPCSVKRHRDGRALAHAGTRPMFTKSCERVKTSTRKCCAVAFVETYFAHMLHKISPV